MDADLVPGLTVLGVGLPSVVLVGVLTALLWYFSSGTATMRDLRLIFERGGDAEQIEPWVIEQVKARVALSSTALAPSAEVSAIWGAATWTESTVAVRAIPLLGGEVASALARARANRGHRRPLPAPANAPTSPAVAPTSPAVAPTSPGPAPGWRPVPGWGVPGAIRSMLTPPPLTPPMYPDDRIRPLPARRPAPAWDELATNPQGWIRVGETNEHRVVTGDHPTNSRYVPSAQPSPAATPELVRTGTQGDDRPVSGTPLPRRNARP
jgi:hypothetical protein